MTNKEDAWIQTFSGTVFNPFNPDPSTISINDIAHALSQICRFGGHSSGLYSVAQHSVKVSRILALELALQGLMHDSAEFAVGDMPKPIKEWLPEYCELERTVWCAIADKFCLPRDLHPDVHRADRIALATEVRDLMKPPPTSWGRWLAGVTPLPDRIVPLTAQQAEDAFLGRFEELIYLDQ